MCTVVVANSNVRALKQSVLSANTGHIVQPNWTMAGTKVCIRLNSNSISKLQLVAYDPGFVDAKVVITNGTPRSIVEHFNATLHAVGSIYQAYIHWLT